MNCYTQSFLCLGAMALAALTPTIGFAAPALQKAKPYMNSLPQKPAKPQPAPTKPLFKTQKQQPRQALRPVLAKYKPVHDKSSHHFKKHSSKSSHNKSCCKSFTTISEHDINKASSKSASGLVLSKPGKYKLCDDVNWKGRTSDSYAITITGNNISLDLDGHFIKQVDTSLSNNFAIQIAGTAEDTLVHNGVIQQFSGGAVIVQPGADCITLDKLDCNRCTYSGVTSVSAIIGSINAFSATILFNGSPADPIEHVVITNCSFCDTGIIGIAPVSFLGTISGTTLTLSTPPLYPLTPGFVLSGASISGAPTIVSGSGTVYTISSPQTVGSPEAMKVTDPNSQFVPFGFVSSIFTNFTNDIKVDNVVVNGNFGYLISWGITFSRGSAIVLSNYEINDVVTFGLGKGLEVAACQDILMEDGAVNNVIMNVIPDSLAFPLGHGAEGTKIGFSQDWTMRRVAFSGNVVQTQVPTDFTSEPVAYIDCAGLMVDAVLDVPVMHGLVEDCSVQGLRNDGGQVPANPTYTAGFNLATGLSDHGIENVHYVRCTASDLSGSVGWVYGFGGSPVPTFFSDLQDITYTDCIAQDIAGTGDAVYSAGYALVDTRFKVIGCTANRITGDAAYGIILDRLPTSEANGCMLLNNLLTNCDTNGIIDKTVGTQDSLITGNYAALNGVGGAGPNYVGLNAFVPIVLWKPYLASPAPATPSSLDNLDIQN
jgi:hypothetical protein